MGEIKSNVAAINLGIKPIKPTLNPVIVVESDPVVLSQKPTPPCLQDRLMFVSDKTRYMYLYINTL